MSENKLNLAVLISGSGSNLQALIDACESPDFPAQITLVISNRPRAYGLKRAEKAGIPAITIDHKDFTGRSDFEERLQETLETAPTLHRNPERLKLPAPCPRCHSTRKMQTGKVGTSALA